MGGGWNIGEMETTYLRDRNVRNCGRHLHMQMELFG